MAICYNEAIATSAWTKGGLINRAFSGHQTASVYPWIVRMKWSTEKKIAVGIAVVLMVLVINALISYRATRRLIDNNQWVTHTHEVLAELEATLSIAKDAETGQ